MLPRGRTEVENGFPPAAKGKTAMSKQFDLVDVFHDGPFTGNPLAVVTAATEDIATEAMQGMTRWFNLSETAFLLPPSDRRADYRVRIFTLERELPFAGLRLRNPSRSLISSMRASFSSDS
jgi:hypothetical protein